MRIIPKMVMNEERVIKINFLVKGCECGSWLSSFFALSLRTADLQKCYWISGQFSRVLVLVYFYGYDLLRRPKKWDALLNKRRTQWCTTLLFKKVLSARSTVFENHQKSQYSWLIQSQTVLIGMLEISLEALHLCLLAIMDTKI